MFWVGFIIGIILGTGIGIGLMGLVSISKED